MVPMTANPSTPIPFVAPVLRTLSIAIVTNSTDSIDIIDCWVGWFSGLPRSEAGNDLRCKLSVPNWSRDYHAFPAGIGCLAPFYSRIDRNNVGDPVRPMVLRR